MFYVLLGLAIIFSATNTAVPGGQTLQMFCLIDIGLEEDTGGSGLTIYGVDILENDTALNCSFYTFGHYSDGF